jgi:hypothetical protein
MAVEKPKEDKAVTAAMVETKAVKTDPNTGQVVEVVPDGFGRHIKERGLDCPCKDC